MIDLFLGVVAISVICGLIAVGVYFIGTRLEKYINNQEVDEDD